MTCLCTRVLCALYVLGVLACSMSLASLRTWRASKNGVLGVLKTDEMFS